MNSVSESIAQPIRDKESRRAVIGPDTRLQTKLVPGKRAIEQTGTPEPDLLRIPDRGTHGAEPARAVFEDHEGRKRPHSSRQLNSRSSPPANVQKLYVGHPENSAAIERPRDRS
eukprot:4546412-Pyramimonas_sp.AAC.1